jgi:hypothetical protein
MSRQNQRPGYLFVFFGCFLAAACGSGSNLTPLNLSVATVEDTVVLHQAPGAAYFNVTAILRNGDTRSLVVELCLIPAQREIGGVWTTVFSPNCLLDGKTPLAADDSLNFPVQVGYTLSGLYPPLDPRMGPGRYRLLFGVRSGDATTPAGSSSGELKPSTSFIVE